MATYIVESEVIIRAVDRPFPNRIVLGVFSTSEHAYHFIEKYLADTKELHTYFTRQNLCSKEEYESFISGERIVAFNMVLGQFEDMIYVRKEDS
jgi:hypothetical protein